MPVFEITGPGGTFEIEGPDAAGAAEAFRRWQSSQAPKEEGVLARAHREGVEALQSSAKGATEFGDLQRDGSIGSTLKTGGALLSGAQFPFSYPLAAGASLLGSGMTAALQAARESGDVKAISRLLGREAPQYSDNQIYEKVRPEMDTALAAMGARGNVPVPTTKQVGTEAKQLYDSVLSRAKYIPVDDAEFAAMSQGATRNLHNANLRSHEYPFTHDAVRDLANPSVNDLAEVVSRRRALNDPGKGIVADPKALKELQRREGVAIGEARKSLMSDIDAIDPISAERLLASDKEWTVFNQAKDADRFLAAGRRMDNFDVSGALRRNFGKIANDADKMRRFSAEEQDLIKGLAGGQYNMLTILGKLDPRRGGLIGLMHGGLGYATGGISAAASGMGFAAQVLSNRMAISKANKLGELIRSRSSSMQKVTGPMQSWGEAGLAFQADPSPKNFARLTLASRNFSNNLHTIGIEFSPTELLKALQGTAPARSEDEE